MKFTGEWQQYSGRIIYGLIGLIIAILILTVGFWKTLLLAIFTGGGYFLGSLKDDEKDFYWLVYQLQRWLHR